MWRELCKFYHKLKGSRFFFYINLSQKKWKQ